MGNSNPWLLELVLLWNICWVLAIYNQVNYGFQFMEIISVSVIFIMHIFAYLEHLF